MSIKVTYPVVPSNEVDQDLILGEDIIFSNDINNLLKYLIENQRDYPLYDTEYNDIQKSYYSIYLNNIYESYTAYKSKWDKILNDDNSICILQVDDQPLAVHKYEWKGILINGNKIRTDVPFKLHRYRFNTIENYTMFSGIYLLAYSGLELNQSSYRSYLLIPIKDEYVVEGSFHAYRIYGDFDKPDEPQITAPTETYYNLINIDGVYYLQIYSIPQDLLNIINACSISVGESDFDGKTHKNDIKRPSRKNISSTPDLPTYYSLSGISGYNLYQIPVDQLDECVSYLNSGVVVSTSSGFLTWIKLLARIVQYAFLDWINNRNDYIISWKMAYYTPTVNLDLDPTINVGATSGIQIANHHITQQYDTIDCGNISIEATSFTDYEPYTYYEIYLPFVGTVPLRADTIAGRTLNVKYVVDNVSGESTCIISTIDSDVKQIIHTYECNLSIDIPYKAFDYLGNIRRNASALVNSVVGAAAGGALMSKSNAYARSALASTSKKVRKDYLAKSASYEDMADSIPESSSEAGYEQPQCIRSNVGSSLLSSMLPRIPYLIIRRVPMYNVNDSNRVYGRPTLEYATLDTYSGFMVKVRQVRLDGLTCTDDEKVIIQSILESGVIINE